MKVGFIGRDGHFIECPEYGHDRMAEKILVEYGYEDLYRNTKRAGEPLDFLVHNKGFLHVQAGTGFRHGHVTVHGSRFFRPSREQMNTLRFYLSTIPNVDYDFDIRIDSLSGEEVRELLED